MLENGYHIYVLKVDLHIPQAQSLKDKRSVVKSIKERIRNRFNVSVSELDGLDKWQVATLGCVSLGTDPRYLDSCQQHLLSFIESFPAVEVCQHDIEIL